MSKKPSARERLITASLLETVAKDTTWYQRQVEEHQRREVGEVVCTVRRGQEGAAAPLAALIQAAPALLEACRAVVRLAESRDISHAPDFHAVALMCSDAVRLATPHVDVAAMRKAVCPPDCKFADPEDPGDGCYGCPVYFEYAKEGKP